MHIQSILILPGQAGHRLFLDVQQRPEFFRIQTLFLKKLNPIPRRRPYKLDQHQTRTSKDRQNWQTRYVVQNPYEGSVAQCSARVGQMDCEAMCRPRVAQLPQCPARTSA